MKNIECITLSIGVTFFLCMMLCSGFVMRYYIFDNYFQLYPISIGICAVTLMAFLSFLVKRISFRISAFDIALSVLLVYYLMRYDYELQLANWKIIYAILLFILWFALRVLFTNMAISRSVLFVGIVAVGCLLAVWGLLQLYGFRPSNHNLFAITGPFYNPGPYSGYLAIIFPVSLSCLLQSDTKTRYLWLLAFLLISCILPAGMSRSAWFALSISSIWVLSVHFKLLNRIKRYFKINHYKVIFYGLLVVIIVGSASVFFFRMKIDSSNGRLFMWQTTCKAITEKPLFGYGPGTFSHVYGETQSNYFALGDYMEQEERVAGAPEYAFNEYLQLCMEGGVILLVLFLFPVIWGICKGASRKEYTACSGLISLLIFALSSYPFQVLPFLMMGVLLLVVNVSGNELKGWRCSALSRVYIFCLLLILLTANVVGVYYLRNVGELSERLYYIKVLKEQSLQKEASIGYGRLYDYCKHNFHFLMGYAECLFNQKRYDEAVVILERAKLVSCHPNIYNFQGRCYQVLGDFVKAERSYKMSSRLLPIRIYPYYLLAKLYAEPSFYNKMKLQEMANIVLLKKPKVYSKAISEMRAEMRILLFKDLNVN